MIIGTPARVSRLEASIRTTIQTSFNSVLEGAEIAKTSLHEGNLLTVDMRKQFFLQQIFAEDGVRYPLAVRRELEEELWALCLYAAAHPEANSPTAEIVLEQWIQREQPWRMGKQPMIRSYFNRKLEGRQIIACVADPTTGAWTQLLEGGLGMAMDGTYISKNMAQQIDRFSARAVFEICNNPAYAYGKAFPQELLTEWSLAFLYGLAVLDVPTADEAALSRLYRRFLAFMEAYISDCEMCPTMIEEGVFIKSFARQIEWTKEYLRGSEERSISKHVTLMMRSRYGYLRHVYEIIGKEFPLHTCFDQPVPTLAPLKRDELQAALDSPDAKVKGGGLGGDVRPFLSGSQRAARDGAQSAPGKGRDGPMRGQCLSGRGAVEVGGAHSGGVQKLGTESRRPSDPEFCPYPAEQKGEGRRVVYEGRRHTGCTG